jgi:transcriptional regulator with XRE-family HTH domain
MGRLAISHPDFRKPTLASCRHYRKITSTFQPAKLQQWRPPETDITIGGMPMQLGEQIGRRIKSLREAKGLTQAQVADRLRKSVETISNFERGKTLTSVVTLGQLARVLNVRIADFFEGAAPAGDDHDLSDSAIIVRNAVDLLPEDDLEIVAGLVKVLEARRRRR